MQITRDEIVERCFSILSIQLDVVESILKLNSHLVDDLGADSLDIVEIGLEIEGEFGINISEETCETWTTIEDVVDFLEKHLIETHSYNSDTSSKNSTSSGNNYLPSSNFGVVRANQTQPRSKNTSTKSEGLVLQILSNAIASMSEVHVSQIRDMIMEGKGSIDEFGIRPEQFSELIKRIYSATIASINQAR